MSTHEMSKSTIVWANTIPMHWDSTGGIFFGLKKKGISVVKCNSLVPADIAKLHKEASASFIHPGEEAVLQKVLEIGNALYYANPNALIVFIHNNYLGDLLVPQPSWIFLQLNTPLRIHNILSVLGR